MDSDLNEKISIALPKSAWLIVFELLATSYEKWRKEKPDDTAAEYMNDFQTEYEHRTDDEQLQLWVERSQLASEARLALEEEKRFVELDTSRLVN
jgi:hypothetical protein